MGKNRKKHFAVIGDPVSHSLSPAMHNAAFKALELDAEYTALHVRPEYLSRFVDEARTDLSGFNITVPHKKAIIPMLDSVSDECMLTESVNTVVNRNGCLYGCSTDGYGLERALEKAFGVSPDGSSFVFLGAGGAVRAVAWHLIRRGAASVSIVNRTFARAEKLVADLRKSSGPNAAPEAVALSDTDSVAAVLSKCDVLVQATSLGLREDDPSPVDPDILPREMCVYDTIYRNTSLLREAAKRGCRTADGRLMLLYQGARSFEIWTGLDAPVKTMEGALENALSGS